MGREEVLARFWWGNLRGREHLGETGVGGRMILKCILTKWDGWACTDLIQNRDGCRAVVSAVMNLTDSLYVRQHQAILCFL